MSDVEYVATDDDVESVESFNSVESHNDEDERNETIHSRRRDLLNEFTRVNGNGTIWSLNETGDASEDPTNGEKATSTPKTSFSTPNAATVEQPKPVLKQLLVECEDFYKSEMQKAEQKIFEQMLNGMKSGGVPKVPEPTTGESVCKCKKMKEKVEKLNLQLKAAQLLAVPALQFSTKSVDFVESANERTTMCIGNFGQTRVAIRAYLVNELFPAVRIRPTELQIEPGQMRSIDLVWTGVQPSNTKSISNGPLSFSFKWTNVPESSEKNDKCPLSWMNEYPVRQYYINIKM